MAHIKPVIFVCFIILLGLGLRVYDLGAESLWKDEAYSYFYASQPIPQLIAGVASNEAAPPLHYLLLHFWIYLFGDHVAAMRSLSVLAGAASLIVVFLLAKKVFNYRVATIATLIMSTHMIEVLYSQYIRLYALFTLFSLLSFFFLVGYFENRKKRYLFLYCFMLVLSLYTSQMALFLMIIQLIIFYYQNKYAAPLIPLLKPQIFHWSVDQWNSGVLKNKHDVTTSCRPSIDGWFLTVQAVALLFYVPWLPFLFAQLSSAHWKLTFSLVERGVPSFLGALGLFFLVLPIISFVFILLFVLYLNKKIRLFQRMKKISGYLWIGFTILVPVIYLLFLPKLAVSFAPVRYLLFLFPLLYILIARKITQSPQPLTFILLAGLLFFNLFTLNFYYVTTTHTPWDKAADLISRAGEPNPSILFDKSGFPSKVIFDFYYDAPYRRIKLSWVDETTLTLNTLGEQDLYREISGSEKLWLVVYNSKDPTHFPLLLEKKYAIESIRSFSDITVYRYTSKEHGIS